MKDLAGKVAVMTGAASGIGAALCRSAAARGMKIVAADIEEVALRGLADELRAGGAEVATVATDVRSAKQVEALADRSFAQFGAVHLLANNAGVVVGGHCWEQSVDDYRWVVDVDFYGVVHGIRAFVPRFIEQGVEAHVLNTASAAGLSMAPGLGPYYASKAAVVSLSETLYLETKEGPYPNIGVSVLCPEIVRTNIGTSGRNRPSDSADEGPETEERTLYEGSLESLVGDSKVLPEQLAERAFAGIEDDRFYILPPEGSAFDLAISGRLDTIRDRGNPTLFVPIDEY